MGKDGQSRAATGSPKDSADLDNQFAGRTAQEFGQIFTNLELQNDRGLAILACALLGYRITASIACRFEADQSEGPVASLIGSGDRGGQLGFGDQCKLAYSLGAISRASLEDLTSMGRIRNRFAHAFAPLTFSEPSIAKLCMKLGKPNGKRHYYVYEKRNVP